MDKQAIIRATADHIQELLSGEGSGHDWWHIKRVWNTAKHIAKEEKADLFITEMGALLHDIADHKFHDGDTTVGPKIAEEWMVSIRVEQEAIAHICQIIQHLSFKGAQVATPMKTMEGKVVQDADRLDAIGAIGIARAFAYGGYKGRELHNPDIKPELHSSFEAYRKTTGPSLNHFYEKLFLLKDRMNTNTGRKIAAERHTFMEAYVAQFLSEWDGEK